MRVAIKEGLFRAVVLGEAFWTVNKLCPDRIGVGIDHKFFSRRDLPTLSGELKALLKDELRTISGIRSGDN